MHAGLAVCCGRVPVEVYTGGGAARGRFVLTQWLLTRPTALATENSGSLVEHR